MPTRSEQLYHKSEFWAYQADYRREWVSEIRPGANWPHDCQKGFTLMTAFDILQQSPLQGKSFAIPAMVGLFTVVTSGVLACVAIVMVLAWLVVRLALTLLQAVIETLSAIGTTYTMADPSIKLVVLILVAYVLYSFFQKVTRRARQ